MKKQFDKVTVADDRQKNSYDANPGANSNNLNYLMLDTLS